MNFRLIVSILALAAVIIVAGCTATKKVTQSDITNIEIKYDRLLTYCCPPGKYAALSMYVTLNVPETRYLTVQEDGYEDLLFSGPTAAAFQQGKNKILLKESQNLYILKDRNIKVCWALIDEMKDALCTDVVLKKPDFEQLDIEPTSFSFDLSASSDTSETENYGEYTTYDAGVETLTIRNALGITIPVTVICKDFPKYQPGLEIKDSGSSKNTELAPGESFSVLISATTHPGDRAGNHVSSCTVHVGYSYGSDGGIVSYYSKEIPVTITITKS